MKTDKEMREEFLKKNQVKKLPDAGFISVRETGAYSETCVEISPRITQTRCPENGCNNKIQERDNKYRNIIIAHTQTICYSCVLKRKKESDLLHSRRRWCEKNNRTMDQQQRFSILYAKYKKAMHEIVVDSKTIQEMEELLKIKEDNRIRAKLDKIKEKNNHSITGYQYDF
tara:strand:+ start:142 stop:654 length:513 start_codon:yes stop_codon:yes gene_type:complete